MLSKYINL